MDYLLGQHNPSHSTTMYEPVSRQVRRLISSERKYEVSDLADGADLRRAPLLNASLQSSTVLRASSPMYSSALLA